MVHTGKASQRGAQMLVAIAMFNRCMEEEDGSDVQSIGALYDGWIDGAP